MSSLRRSESVISYFESASKQRSRAIEGMEGITYFPLEKATILVVNRVGRLARERVCLERLSLCIKPDYPVVVVNTDSFSVVEQVHSGCYRVFERGLRDGSCMCYLENILASNPDHRPVTSSEDGSFICGSPGMRKLAFEIERIAHFDFDILIAGETGVGKDAVAREIHRRSPRSDGPFVQVPIRSLSDSLIESELFGHEKGSFSNAERSKVGKFEMAQGGTLYIPEVSTLSEAIQLKLLYFMQYKSISRVGQDPRTPELALDIRILAATNDEVSSLVRRGLMRADFFYRIQALRLTVPPLRDRLDSIEELLFHFVGMYAPKSVLYSIARDTIPFLKCYSWPGNVRELEHAVKVAIVNSDDGILQPDDFAPALTDMVGRNPCPADGRPDDDDIPTLSRFEENMRCTYFNDLLHRNNNNIADAAKVSGLSVQGLRKTLKRHGIEWMPHRVDGAR